MWELISLVWTLVLFWTKQTYEELSGRQKEKKNIKPEDKAELWKSFNNKNNYG